MIDVLQRFPEQNIERRPTECTAETVADILGNFYKTPFHPGFTYAATLKLDKTTPTTAGANPLTAMQSALVYGVLPLSEQDFDAITTSELFEANWPNYDPEDKTSALKYLQNGVKTLWNLQDIITYLYQYRMGASFSMKWYDSFNNPVNGVLPAPQGNFTYHTAAAYGLDPRGLQLKPWLGPDFGDKGYCYLPQEHFYNSFEYAYGFTPDSWRWLQLVMLSLNKPWAIPDILPLLKATK